MRNIEKPQAHMRRRGEHTVVERAAGHPGDCLQIGIAGDPSKIGKLGAEDRSAGPFNLF